MRRAYIEAHVDLPEATALALKWAGGNAMIRVPTTTCVDNYNPWLRELGIPITSPSRKSKYFARAQGTLISFDLDVTDLLADDRSEGVDGLVAIGAYGTVPYAAAAVHHGPWITAFEVEHLGGHAIAPVTDALPPIKATMTGVTNHIIERQGLLDKRERSEVIEALMFLRNNGIPLDPDGVMVEAIRNGWGDDGPEEVRSIALDLMRGKALRFTPGRIAPELLNDWLRAT